MNIHPNVARLIAVTLAALIAPLARKIGVVIDAQTNAALVDYIAQVATYGLPLLVYAITHREVSKRVNPNDVAAKPPESIGDAAIAATPEPAVAKAAPLGLFHSGHEPTAPGYGGAREREAALDDPRFGDAP